MKLPLPVITAVRPPLPGEPDAQPTEAFVPVDLDGLLLDTVLDFNLFLPAGRGRLLFFRSPNLEFNATHRTRLIENNVHTVYIRAQERGAYQQYLEQHLPTLLASPEMPAERKANLLYTVSANVVQDCLTDPRSGAIVDRTRRVAESTIDFVLRSDRSVAQLATLMAADYYTFTHSINVSVFGVALAHKAGVSREDLADFAVGAMLHDIGKSEIPKELLTSTGPLTPDQYRQMKEHVAIGERLLSGHRRLSPIAMLPVKQHHEKVDGSGYPRGLEKDQVHLFGRISAIADCFDAMTTNRSYQHAKAPYEALFVMRNKLRTKFDQDLLETFIRLLKAPDAAEQQQHAADVVRASMRTAQAS
jgi:HD-GYP domain-containing protein (c-di-GMP phosphodiesterase class II)